MRKKFSVIGNSLGIIIEKPILDLLGMGRDTLLEMTTDGFSISLKPIQTSDFDPTLEAIIEHIRHEFEPTKIILFGSRAKGTHTSGSDYDICCVFNTVENTMKLAGKITASLIRSKIYAPVDVVTATEIDLRSNRKIFKEISDGKTIFESSRSRVA